MMELSYTIKKNKNVAEVIVTILLCLIFSLLFLKNQLVTLIVITILLSISLWFFASDRQVIRILSEIQLFLGFFPLIFLYVTEIPKMGPLPLSPLFFFIGIYGLSLVLKPRVFSHTLKQPTGDVFLLMVLCWFYQYFIFVVFAGGSLVDLSFFKILGMCFAMKLFTKSSVKRTVWATRILAGVLLISMAWFLGEILLGSPHPIRLSIYHSVHQTYLDQPHVSFSNATYPNGFASLLFLFGYQIAVSTPLSTMLFFIEKRKSWRILWAFGSSLSLLALLFAGERSGLLAGGLALFLFLYLRKQFKTAVLIVCIISLSMFIFSQIDMKRVGLKHDIFTRMQEEESKFEGIGRIKLQFIGLRVIAENPLGLILAEKSWGEEADRLGADFSAWEGQEIAVHNGYLGRIISYGWVLGLLIGIVLFRLLRHIRNVFSWKKYQLDGLEYAEIVALSLLSVLIQALFHNASIFTFNSISLTVMFLFLTWVDLFTVNNPGIVKQPKR